MEYDNNNQGVLFRNETATEENKQPYMSGKCEVNGKEMQIAAWMRESKNGKKFLSLKFQEPRKQEIPVKNNDNTNTTADADIPF